MSNIDEYLLKKFSDSLDRARNSWIPMNWNHPRGHEAIPFQAKISDTSTKFYISYSRVNHPEQEDFERVGDLYLRAIKMTMGSRLADEQMSYFEHIIDMATIELDPFFDEGREPLVIPDRFMEYHPKHRSPQKWNSRVLKKSA